MECWDGESLELRIWSNSDVQPRTLSPHMLISRNIVEYISSDQLSLDFVLLFQVTVYYVPERLLDMASIADLGAEKK